MATAKNFDRDTTPNEPTITWDTEPNRWPLGPAEPLDDCWDCHGAVQRLARHSQGLGELWETPLAINTHQQPYSPRLPGPGILTLALDTAARYRREVIA